MERIGLVAGEGRLPIVFADMAKKKGDTVIAFGVKGVTDKSLESHVDKMHWLDWGSLKKAVFLLAMERIRKIVMLGKIKKESIFKNDEKMDDAAKNVLGKIKDKKDYSILKGITDLLGKFGVEVMDSTTYLKDLVPSKGVLTKRVPTGYEKEDIEFARNVAKEMARFDIGQAVAVKDKTVIAVEAMEGTDETISRVGGLVNGGFVVVKVSRPHQDMRFDVPLVGLDTLKALIKTGGKVLALESDRTLLMDREEVIKLADQNDISIVVI